MNKQISIKVAGGAGVLAALALAAMSSAAFAQGSGQMAAPAMDAAHAGMERCFGVARAGHNDCAAGHHTCAGRATRNGDRASFVYLPAGACAKLVHGSTTPGR